MPLVSGGGGTPFTVGATYSGGDTSLATDPFGDLLLTNIGAGSAQFLLTGNPATRTITLDTTTGIRIIGGSGVIRSASLTADSTVSSVDIFVTGNVGLFGRIASGALPT